jgi:endo-1,4-beta-D-glucanase Y
MRIQLSRFLAMSLMGLALLTVGCGSDEGPNLTGDQAVGGTATSAVGGLGGGVGTGGGASSASSNVGAGGGGGGTANTSGGDASQSGSGGSSSGGNSSDSGGFESAGGSTGTGAAAAGGTASGGQVGSTGGVPGTGGLWRGPTPATTTANFPFPQNRESFNCIYPTAYRNEDVQTVYDQWKAHLVTSDGAGGFRRVTRPAEPGLAPNSTVSEGIAYGMIISVYMDDQVLFDDLWNYALLHRWTYVPYPDTGGTTETTLLMNWYIFADGSLGADPGGDGAAIDADEDMAWALVMADRQWGGQGSLDRGYIDYARELIDDIWTYEILDGQLPKNGTNWGDWDNLNISYFAPAFYRVFAQVGGNDAWSTAVVDCVYSVIDGNLIAANGNQDNGLVPAFSTSNGAAAAAPPDSGPLPFSYQYDSCRTPFRIGLDACLFGESRAVGYVAKTSQFFSSIGAANIVDGYQLDGAENPQYPSSYQGLSAAFIGPAGVGAMHSSAYQAFVDDVYGLVRQNNMWAGGQYYDESWTMLTLLMMTGNFLDYTQY